MTRHWEESMGAPDRPDGWVDDDEEVVEDQAADWDEWITFLNAAKEATGE